MKLEQGEEQEQLVFEGIEVDMLAYKLVYMMELERQVQLELGYMTVDKQAYKLVYK